MPSVVYFNSQGTYMFKKLETLVVSLRFKLARPFNKTGYFTSLKYAIAHYWRKGKEQSQINVPLEWIKNDLCRYKNTCSIGSFKKPPFTNVGALKSMGLCFINRNIGVLSSRLLLLEGVNKTFIVWVELSSVILRDHFDTQPLHVLPHNRAVWTQGTSSLLMKQAQTKAGRLFMEAIYSDENSINRHITLDPCYRLIKDRLTRWTVVIHYKNP